MSVIPNVVGKLKTVSKELKRGFGQFYNGVTTDHSNYSTVVTSKKSEKSSGGFGH